MSDSVLVFVRGVIWHQEVYYCYIISQMNTYMKEVPESERWRLGLLDSLLALRSQQEKEGADTKRVVAMLSSLCAT